MKKIMLLIGTILYVTLAFANEKKVIYYANGNKHFEYLTASDLMNGEFTAWYENGRLKIKGQFKNNQKNGIWTVWDAQGVMRAQRNYEDDYSFQVVKEWDSTGHLIDRAITQQKNERLIAARSKEASEKQARYMQRYWKSIPENKEANAFLFKDNFFFNFLITQSTNSRMYVYGDDRCNNQVTDLQSIKAYKGATPVEYIIKEDQIFTRDHQVMQVKEYAICPVVLINGEKKEVGWFYLQNVRNNRQATDEVENIITNLEKHNCASTVIRSTVNNTNREGAAVTPEDADSISLSCMDFEAQAWIASVAGDK